MNKIQNSSQGFTLLELLVVVLIIGILAAIALPQYQMAVGKAKFATLKNLTRSIAESSQRYYLLNNIYPRSVNDLDIDLDIKSSSFDSYLIIYLNSGEECSIWKENQQERVACMKKILGKGISYYIDRNSFRPRSCLVYSVDQTDKANKLCQKETGKTPEQANCPTTNYCYYLY